jgi:hypothetical protein
MCQVAFDALLEAAAACRIGLRRFALISNNEIIKVGDTKCSRA